MPPWILVSPASRGLGLALARRLMRTTDLPVVATARKDLEKVKEEILKGDEVKDESRLHLMTVDVNDEQTMPDAASQCSSLFSTNTSPGKVEDASQMSHLHLAFVLPGMLNPEKSPAQIDYDQVLNSFKINTIGPMMMMKHFSQFLPRKATPLPLLQSADAPSSLNPDHATWAMMSARVGSITDNKLGGWFSYRASKAAVTQTAKTFDNYLKGNSANNAISIALHPGTVKTGLSKGYWDSTKEGKLFSPEYSAECLCDVVKGLGIEGRGKFWDWEGKEILP